jgi:asparagine synthase (glutamine-hydrolysing)
MCGIFGIISTSAVREEQIRAGLSLLAHRGPDDSGIFCDGRVGLGHQRLSIIDIDSGHQPIFNEDGTKCIVFNGEIYNYLELRDLLIKKGHLFTTKSDTETILHAYEEWGENCVQKLRGMFAFAIWDATDKRLFMARDRLGIKPLFYSEYGGKFSFASEMKAILADQEFPRDIDESAQAAYFTLSYIPASLTIFSKIRKLLPGHTMTWKSGKVQIRKYWDLCFMPDRSKDEDYFMNGFMELIHDAVRIRLMSEVPFGAFLSGGIDSSVVVALMSRMIEDPVNTFCIGFGGDTGGYLDERKYARMVAERYASNHREFEVWPKPDDVVEKIVRAFDEPFADDSTIPSYYICQMARQHVTVALSGLGGDEAFAGYERYLGFQLRNLYHHFPSFLREKAIPRLVERMPERADGHYTLNHMKRFVRAGCLQSDLSYFSYISILNPNTRESLFSDRDSFNRNYESCRDIILSYFNSANVMDSSDSLNRALYCDLMTYVPEDILAVTDRMSMHHSLEIRVPFLDHVLLEFCAKIPPEIKIKWFQKKYLLKKAVARLIPKEVLNHRKQGFVGPMTTWLKRDMKSYVMDALSKGNLRKHAFFNLNGVQQVMAEHFAGREIHDTLIWAMIVYQKWYDTYIDK